jgi:hypothetical protein
MADITLQTLKDNPKILAAALAYCKKEQNAESILFYYDKADAKVIYEKYVAHNAPDALRVNLSGSVAEPMHALATKNDWKSPQWKDCLEKARFEIARLWNNDIARRFMETPEYKAATAAAKAATATSAVLTAQKAAATAVAAQPTSSATAKLASAAATAAAVQKEAPVAEPIKADPKKAAKLLGITNAKSIALLTKANDLSFKGDKNAALRVMGELVENEDMKMTPEQFMKEFQKLLAKNQKLNKV